MRTARKRITVDVRDTTDFYYGQKVYRIEPRRHNAGNTFKEKCPVCDDTKKVEIKGYTFKCPYCEGSRSDPEATQIMLRNYDVVEYIINRFEVNGADRKNAYSGDGLLNDRNLPFVRWYGFTRWGNGLHEVTSRQFSEYDFREVDPDKVDINRPGDHCFFSKSEAKKYCSRLHERQKGQLEKFNAEHGTDHAYPFEY